MLRTGELKAGDRDGIGQCPMLFAIDSDIYNVKLLEELVELGCDVNSIDGQGDSCLHYACYLENKEIEKWLVDVKAISKDVKNKEGLTPYD